MRIEHRAWNERLEQALLDFWLCVLRPARVAEQPPSEGTDAPVSPANVACTSRLEEAWPQGPRWC